MVKRHRRAEATMTTLQTKKPKPKPKTQNQPTKQTKDPPKTKTPTTTKAAAGELTALILSRQPRVKGQPLGRLRRHKGRVRETARGS